MGRRILEESHDFLQLFLGLVDAGDIREADLDVLLDKHPGFALPNRHERAEALPHPSRQKAPDEKEKRDRHDPGKQRGNPGAFDNAGIFDFSRLQLLGDVGIDAHRQ